MKYNATGHNETPTRQSDSPRPTIRRSDKPAILYLENGRSIQVGHHFDSLGGLAVVVDTDETDKGVDLKIPYDQITAIELNETRSGKEAIGKLSGRDPR